MAQQLATRKDQGGNLSTRKEHPIQRMQRDFETLFNRLSGGWLTPYEDLGPLRMWDFDVMESDQEITVRAELPGFEENDLDIQINQNVLIVKAEKEQQDNGYEERRSFFQTVALPAGVDAERVQATYRNGVLEVHIPKPPSAQTKHIKLQGPSSQQGPSNQKEGEPSSQKAKK